MPPPQLSIETLRGFGAFTRVIARGKTYEKQPIKAFVYSCPAKKTLFYVGYAVTKKVRTAAKRNKMKRLMKEAFRANKASFINQINSGTQTEIVFMFNGSKEIAPTMVRFESIVQALSSICSMMKKT
jgi:ribonuclease P protein component